MGRPLRVLIIEDSEDDTRLIMRKLERGGYGPVSRRVETPEAMKLALKEEPWDIIIADYTLPRFDAPAALQRLHQSGLDLPFVIVSGNIGEDTAVAAMKAGAHDYIMKDNLKRLLPAVERELREARGRMERKQAEIKLLVERQNFRNSMDSSPVGIQIVTREGELLYANQAMLSILGYTSMEELRAAPIGRPSEGPAEYEMTITRRDGKARRLTACRQSVVWNGHAQYQVIYQDITERIEAEAKAKELQVLKEVDKLRSQLLSNVSHELRTPLASIKGFVSTLLRTDAKWSEEEQRDFLQTINQESDRLTRLISDLLDVSRIDAGALKLDRDSYRISEVLESIDSRLAILTSRHQLQKIVPPDLPPVLVDEMRIGQVLTNLVDNAVKFSPEGSEITIAARLNGDRIVVSVADHGEGIPAQLLDRLFDRFYQVESVATGRKNGTGLGLSICRGIVQAHGGRIWVESKLGEGSKFSFSLPLAGGEGLLA